MLIIYSNNNKTMSESYTVVLNTSNNVNRVGDFITSTYNINWNSLLPPGIQKFAMTVSTRTALTTTALSAAVLLNVIGIGTYCMDQTGSRSSACLAIIPGTNGNTNTYSFQSLYSDDNAILVDRPQGPVTISWTQFNGSPAAGLPTNVTFLNFTPIYD